jgi:anti-sigma B factor antagonist
MSAMTRDELFIDLAVKAKLLTPAQLEDCRKLRGMLEENAFTLTLSEIIAKKEFLNPDQIRLINVAIRYEELKREDEALGDFISRKGFLPQEKIQVCLAAQELPFKEGRHFPRLEELLSQKSYLTAQQMHVILRAREQLEQQDREPGSSPRMPQLRPSLPPREPFDSAQGKPEPPPRPLPASLRSLEAGLKQESLKVSFRRSRIQGETYAAVLDLVGSLDGHTAMKFDEFLHALTNAGFVHIIFVCEKLAYISSAGIGVLAGAIKRCRDGKGDLRLCSVDDKMRRVMQIIGLMSLVRTYDNERAAVASYKYG